MAVCSACPWDPDDEADGTLTFPGGFTIPNHAVRFTGLGTLPLEIDLHSGDDFEASRGYSEWDRTAWTRPASLTLEMSFLCDPDGEPYLSDPEDPNSLDPAAGWAANFALLDELADATATGASGTQVVSYQPWPGATPVDLTMKVKPPTLTGAVNGVGGYVTLDVIVYNPEVLTADALAAPATGITGDCVPPWDVDEELAKGYVIFESGYTIPNAAVRFVGDGASALGVRNFVGEDIEAYGAIHPYPMVEKRRVAPLTLQLFFGLLPDGTPVASAAEGAKRNIRLLNAVSGVSAQLGQWPAQEVEWHPQDGRPDYGMYAIVAPLTIGTVTNGVGANAGMVLTITNPADNLYEL